VSIFLESTVFYITTDKDVSYYTMMGKDENLVALLERGKIIQADVTKAYYEHLAPAGWRVKYDFYTLDPSKRDNQFYWGRSQGPKSYYAHLSN
jgi:hypothetical protein